MEFIPLSLLGGILTILAPCVFPLLPVIIGGSLTDKHPYRPLIITLSLAVSVVVFTLVLRVSTALLGIPAEFWKVLSGGLVLMFGLSYLFPLAWARVSHALGLEKKSNEQLQKAGKQKGIGGMVILGMSLGPVFASCSPTYALVLATVLPQNLFIGVINIIVYAMGLSLMMFLVAFFGQKLVKRMKWATNPNGMFRKILGILFLIVGLAIITGADKMFETWVLDQGYFDLTQYESQLLEKKGY